MSLTPAISYLREGCNFMPLRILILTFKAIILTTKSSDLEHVMPSEEHTQPHDVEPSGEGLSSTPTASVCANYTAARYESSVKGIFYQKRIYVSSPCSSHQSNSFSQLRTLWSSLTRCLLECHVLTAPMEPFFLALHSGASIGCADTRDFERLLAHLIFSDGLGGNLPPLANFGLAEWAVILNACASSTWNRAGYIQALRDPLLDFVVRSTNEPFFMLRGLSDHDLLLETPPRPEVEARNLQDFFKKNQQLCIELCHFLESVNILYAEGDEFWDALRGLIDAWIDELQVRKTNRDFPGSSSGVFSFSDSEIQFWIQEWTKSFNWSVKMAGYPGRVIAPEDDEEIDGACIAEIGKSN
ncbi:unnamed protein product [Phytomonas sp. Hart1]|nr:unnamed protein product [Phytomonas sp. Hart1]|eukprot:CCW68651.1 unnamed protein product [Phytomonas sp. isolate Hart1]